MIATCRARVYTCNALQDFGDDHDQLLTSSDSERQPGGATARSSTTDSPASQRGKRMKSLEDLSGQ